MSSKQPQLENSGILELDRIEPLKSPLSVMSITDSSHPLATTREYAVISAANIDNNDTAWNHLYGSLIQGLGLSPKNFQLIFPFMTWDWPIASTGYTAAAQHDFLSTVPQFSATGAYVSAGTSFNDTYNQMLNVIAASTSDPKLQADILQAWNMLTLATNNYDTIYSQATEAYLRETGGSNTPAFSEWLGGMSAKSWAAKLASAGKNVDSQQEVYNELVSQTETPGLKDAIIRFNNKDYYTQFQDPSLSKFPQVPAYSLSMDATTWLNKVKSGTGGSKGEISFTSKQATYDYSKTWAQGSASINYAFWSVNVGGAWEEIKEFSTDNSLEVTISFEAWDQISIQAGRWYNGAFVASVAKGPFKRGFSPYGDNANKAVWGKEGIMSVQKVGMIVCYKPKFTIKVSKSSFESFSKKWSVSAGLRIGPFNFSGGGGSSSSGWKSDANSCTFTGESTAETALILGTSINLINAMEANAAQNKNLTAIKGEFKMGGFTFKYLETSYGTNRGIDIWREGVAHDLHSYKFSPNPHNEDSWYNKHQSAWYEEAAWKTAQLEVANNAWPAFNTQITVHGHDYALVQP